MSFTNKVLVVGGQGYIGKHLQKKFPNFTYTSKKEFDLNNREQIKKFLYQKEFDLCIILAAVISYEKKVDFNSTLIKTNLLGLNNLLEILKNINKNIKIIYFSSMTVYSINNTLPVNERGKMQPFHAYGLSKVLAENLIKYYNFKSVIIRIPGIYGGERKNGFIYNTIYKLRNAKTIEIDTSNLGFWETMHIEDMLHVFSIFLEKYQFKNNFEIFNISYGEKTDFIETIKFLSSFLKSKSKIKVMKKYKDFYLSNKKISKYATPPMQYKERLLTYIEDLK